MSTKIEVAMRRDLIRPTGTGCALIFLLLVAFPCFSGGAVTEAKTVQSQSISFPQSGKVIVRVRERGGQFPDISFTSAVTGKVLLNYVFTDKGGLLKPDDNDLPSLQPFLRFQVVRVKEMPSPMILAVAVVLSGSDHAFYGNVIAEVDGKLRVLAKSPLFLNVQGGLHLGYLNKSLGYGLASWTFVWDEGAHYDYHPYKIDLYTIRQGRLILRRHYVSRKRYLDGVEALQEFGIKARDLRRTIPKMRDYFEEK